MALAVRVCGPGASTPGSKTKSQLANPLTAWGGPPSIETLTLLAPLLTPCSVTVSTSWLPSGGQVMLTLGAPPALTTCTWISSKTAGQPRHWRARARIEWAPSPTEALSQAKLQLSVPWAGAKGPPSMETETTPFCTSLGVP